MQWQTFICVRWLAGHGMSCPVSSPSRCRHALLPHDATLFAGEYGTAADHARAQASWSIDAEDKDKCPTRCWNPLAKVCGKASPMEP